MLKETVTNEEILEVENRGGNFGTIAIIKH